MKKKILAILLTLSLISGMALPGTMAVEAETASNALSVETESNASDETAYTGTLICELDEHSHSEGECYTLSEEPNCGLVQTHVHDDDSCYEMQGQEDEETGKVTEVKVLICEEEEIIPHEHGDGCYTAGELTCAVTLSEGHTHGEGCYQTANELTCGLSEDENHTHVDECYTTTGSLVCTETESAGHAHEAACYSASTLTCDWEEIPEHTHSTDCYEMPLTCEKTEHRHTAECYQAEDTCTCDAAEGEAHAEDCPMYVAPECTCGAEGLFHTSNCPLYEEPVTAAVYAEKDGVYTLLDTHGSASPLDMSAYNGKTVYILANTQPQNLYFAASGYFESGVEFSVSESEYALLTSGGDKLTNHTALLTVAENTPADTEFTLSARGWVVTSYTVTIKVLDKLPADPTKPEISEVSADRKATVEAVLADVIPALPENTTRSTYCFNIDPPESFVEGTEVEVVVPVGLSVAENVDVAVAVYHMADDGSLKEVLEGALNEDGDIVFTTDSFSEFYFTVDFTYNGVKVSFDVGGDITLSLLMAMLGIDKGIQDVADVAITGDAADYVSVEKMVFEEFYDEDTDQMVKVAEQDWRIVSNGEAFSVEGSLTISFQDGSSVAILVTDAEQSSETITSDIIWTLSENMTLNGQITIQEGKTLTIKLDSSVTDDISITRNFTAGMMFSIGKNAKLVIQGNSDNSRIILDGGTDGETGHGKNGTAIQISDSQLELNNVTIQNMYRDGEKVDNSSRACGINRTGNYGDTVTMENVTVQDCLSYDDTGVLRLSGIVTMTNCKFLNNKVDDKYGGALKSGGSTVFCQMTMTGCYASGNYSSGWGGFFLWAAGGVKTNETSQKRETSWAKLNDCTIENNEAKWLGGGISVEAVMTLNNCTIQNNKAAAGGGIAVFPYTRTGEEGTADFTRANGLTLGSGNEIVNNAATATTESITPDIKGLSGENGTLITYSSGGGGIWCYLNKGATTDADGNLKDDAWSFTFSGGSGNTISNNTSRTNGGGVFMEMQAGKSMKLSMEGATISENTATMNGGGVALKNADLSVQSGSITGNTASQNGGGVHINNGCYTMQGGSISENTAQQNGGGLYLTGSEKESSMTGGDVTKNVASQNGGGIYCEGTTMSFATGSITKNQAACGGGVCVASGGTLKVTGGGFITENKAVGTPDSDVTTAYQTSPVGTGGGIAVLGASGKTTSFTLSGDEVGIYKNLADFAADDVFANAVETILTVPAVDQMNLSGMGNTKPDGWFEDYHKDDTQYSSGTKMITDTDTDDIIRYRDGAALDTPNIHKITNQSYSTESTYVCMTLGVSFGSLTISKSGYNETLDPNQSFIFYVEGTDEKTNHIKLTVMLSAANSWSTTIQTLPLGNYKVTEQDGWSWRYDPKENTGTQTEELTADVLAGYVSFENERKQNLWLDGNSWCVNLFKDGEAAKKSPDED